MAFAKKKTDTVDEVEIIKLSQGRIRFNLLGTSPMICEAMSEKVKRELLLPARKKTKVERSVTLRHNPYEEFQGSLYLSDDDNSPTLVTMPAASFKAAMCSVATDIPGAARAPLARMTWVIGQQIAVYGVPKLKMDVVKLLGINRVPDIRTRAVLLRWAASIDVCFMRPQLNETAIANLLAAAGVIRGIGGWRPERGSGNFGQFELVNDDHPEFVKLTKKEGRAAQLAAYENPKSADKQTEDLYHWYLKEVKTRGFGIDADEPANGTAAKKTRKRATATEVNA